MDNIVEDMRESEDDSSDEDSEVLLLVHDINSGGDDRNIHFERKELKREPIENPNAG